MAEYASLRQADADFENSEPSIKDVSIDGHRSYASREYERWLYRNRQSPVTLGLLALLVILVSLNLILAAENYLEHRSDSIKKPLSYGPLLSWEVLHPGKEVGGFLL
ncbi:hypothetical protein UA08_06304 [Talaromyces atroroseus]|uniref:Uncharacterized protein n=1 Tax=Talaromyces atroroseus TaxID=1441469 RepID=A0A225ASW2_TALAT|nr:hypothetical protein UA08_06304 [Talaromyces atroroseus]OKL58689.1 hypothetical protein UA08_06304 [Talaromyces atroroseus]